MTSVYETYTYEELKNLPDDQKITALKELKSIYPDNKDLAKHLDAAHIAVSNMVGKYLEGKQVGRKKMTEEEKTQAKEQRKAEKKLKEQQEQLEKQVQYQKEEEKEEKVIITPPEIKNEEPNVILNAKPIIEENQPTQSKTNSNSFSIKLDKTMNGEEAITRLSGVANSLLKDNEYRVSLIIEEVGEV